MKLYHATLASNVPSIQKLGLLVSDGSDPMWEGSETDGLLFLADDRDEAYSFVDAAQDDMDEPYCDEDIVVFEVDTKHLVKKDLAPDRNILLDAGEKPHAFEYPHDIPARYLSICKEQQLQAGR